jgi:hypothetical protein
MLAKAEGITSPQCQRLIRPQNVVTHDPLALNFLGIDQTGFPDLKAKFQNMY